MIQGYTGSYQIREYIRMHKGQLGMYRIYGLWVIIDNLNPLDLDLIVII